MDYNKRGSTLLALLVLGNHGGYVCAAEGTRSPMLLQRRAAPVVQEPALEAEPDDADDFIIVDDEGNLRSTTTAHDDDVVYSPTAGAKVAAEAEVAPKDTVEVEDLEPLLGGDWEALCEALIVADAGAANKTTNETDWSDPWECLLVNGACKDIFAEAADNDHDDEQMEYPKSVSKNTTTPREQSQALLKSTCESAIDKLREEAEQFQSGDDDSTFSRRGTRGPEEKILDIVLQEAGQATELSPSSSLSTRLILHSALRLSREGTTASTNPSTTTKKNPSTTTSTSCALSGLHYLSSESDGFQIIGRAAKAEGQGPDRRGLLLLGSKSRSNTETEAAKDVTTSSTSARLFLDSLAAVFLADLWKVGLFTPKGPAQIPRQIHGGFQHAGIFGPHLQQNKEDFDDDLSDEEIKKMMTRWTPSEAGRDHSTKTSACTSTLAKTTTSFHDDNPLASKILANKILTQHLLRHVMNNVVSSKKNATPSPIGLLSSLKKTYYSPTATTSTSSAIRARHETRKPILKKKNDVVPILLARLYIHYLHRAVKDEKAGAEAGQTPTFLGSRSFPSPRPSLSGMSPTGIADLSTMPSQRMAKSLAELRAQQFNAAARKMLTCQLEGITSSLLLEDKYKVDGVVEDKDKDKPYLFLHNNDTTTSSPFFPRATSPPRHDSLMPEVPCPTASCSVPYCGCAASPIMIPDCDCENDGPDESGTWLSSPGSTLSPVSRTSEDAATPVDQGQDHQDVDVLLRGVRSEPLMSLGNALSYYGPHMPEPPLQFSPHSHQHGHAHGVGDHHHMKVNKMTSMPLQPARMQPKPFQNWAWAPLGRDELKPSELKPSDDGIGCADDLEAAQDELQEESKTGNKNGTTSYYQQNHGIFDFDALDELMSMTSTTTTTTTTMPTSGHPMLRVWKSSSASSGNSGASNSLARGRTWKPATSSAKGPSRGVWVVRLGAGDHEKSTHFWNPVNTRKARSWKAEGGVKASKL
ncbi:unnamed protein product [Amoebophrya sp. A25]|nr:unnamed protein product [Amoebophrya sp. A25]|eukprot:GSA25T00003741001.1